MFKKITLSSFLIIAACLAGLRMYSLDSIRLKKNDPAVISYMADKNSHQLMWFPRAGKSILVIARSGDQCYAVPQMDDVYTADNTYGKGSVIGGGFVVYKGDGASVTVNGLEPGTRYYFHVYELDAEGRYTSDKSIFEPPLQDMDQKQSPNSPLAVSCVCPPVAGVTCTVSGTTNTGTSVASAAGCPHVGYCDGPGSNNPWTGLTSTGVIQYMFSSPVSAATLRANSVNVNDYATISSSGGSGGSLSISGVVCMSFSGLVIGPLTVASSYGGVSWTVNSTGSYTMVTATNTGAQSGWVAACPTAITPVTLPIELVSLKAECVSGEVKIAWQTSSEKNNSYFSVQRSFDAENWEVIGHVVGAGNSTALNKYSFTDNALFNPVTYYRLKQVDLDGKFKLTEMVSASKCMGEDIGINVYPNPARNEVVIKAGKEGMKLEIYNVFGELCGAMELIQGDNKLNISGLSNGTYFFRSLGADSSVNFTKVLINN